LVGPFRQLSSTIGIELIVKEVKMSKAIGAAVAAVVGGVTGAGIFGTIGGIGIVACGTGVGITLGPFIAIGAGVGLVGYGLVWLGSQFK
jgi:hypothetical protein